MKVLTPEIAWHQHGESKVNKPIFGVSFHPHESIFATAGGDNVVILWRLNSENSTEAAKEDVSLFSRSLSMFVVHIVPSSLSYGSGVRPQVFFPLHVSLPIGMLGFTVWDADP